VSISLFWPAVTRAALSPVWTGADLLSMRRRIAAVALVAALPAVLIGTPADSAVRSVPGTRCAMFPANNYWHADVSRLRVNARSAAWMSHMSPTRRLHPDFGPSGGVPYGIPITVVAGTHAKVPVTFTYAAESDRVRYPLGSDSRIEGGASSTGDRHVIMVDAATCRLYETFATRKSGTRWYAGSGATWDLGSNALRPRGWTSADAAGLPILPGLLRYDEVLAGNVDHAIRFTTNVTDRRFVWPARHQAGSVTNANYPPMGARFRLKASFPISSYRADTRVVLQAMKRHGLVLADNGSPWYFQGPQDTRWPTALLDQLKSIPASAFEAVDGAQLWISSGSAQARQL
jgi:hypothetical protein